MIAPSRHFNIICLSFALGFPGLFAHAQSQHAKKIMERIAGTKISADYPLLKKVDEKLQSGDTLGAIKIAQEHPNFYNVTIKQMALKMSTREQTISLPLNDFAAMFIGVTRDDLDARLLLTGNFHYRAPMGVVANNDITRSNSHYEELDQKAGLRQLNLGDILVRTTGQVIANGDATSTVANPDPAGVLTSRSFLGAHAVAGTNRRPVEFVFKQFMCVNMEDWSDTGASDARIGRDIDRLPGGDHLRFLTTCKGCHTGMDGFRGAFARWDWQDDGANKYLINAFVHTDARRYTKFINGVSNKMNHNETTYPQGYVTKDSSWVNNARGPANESLFGWRGTGTSVNSGQNVQQFGQLIANSKRFPQCMVKRVFEAICRKDLDFKQNMSFIESQANRFEAGGYKLKDLVAQVLSSSECGL